MDIKIKLKNIIIATVGLFIFHNSYAQVNTEVKLFLAQNEYQKVLVVCDSMLQLDARNVMVWQYKGMAEKSLYKYADATNSYKQALAIYPESLSIQYALARVQELGGDDASAIIGYTLIITEDSLHTNAKSHLASIYKGNKDYIKAADLFSQLVKQDTTNAYYYSQLGYCCYKMGLNLPSISYYKTAIDLNPNDFKSKLNLVNNLTQLKYYEEATYLLDSFLLIYPKHIKLLKKQAYLLAIGGNYLDAVRAYEELVALGDTSMSTCKYYGQSLYNNAEYAEAAIWLDRFLKKKPDDFQNHMVIGLAYQNDYQYEKSIEHLDISLFLKYDKRLTARLHKEKAETYVKYGDYVCFRDSLKMHQLEYYNNAKDEYVTAISFDASYNDLHKYLGMLYEDKLKNIPLALYHFEKYYDGLDYKAKASNQLDEYQLEWIQKKIIHLKEEAHFIGE